MAFYGLCYITYDGTKNIGRPSNSFKQALEKSRKSFLGQLRVIPNPKNPRCQGLEILRNGQLLLKTLNVHHLELNNSKNGVLELSFFGDKVPEIIEFVDKSVLTGFQMNSKNFVTITIHMHFINYVKYGNLTNVEQQLYREMIHELENTAANNGETRKVAIESVACNKELLDKISSSANQENIRNLEDKFPGTRRDSVPQQPTAVDRILPCTNYECQCHTCLTRKQAVIYSLTEEYERKLEDEMRKKEEEKEQALISVTHSHQEEIREKNDVIARLEEKLSKQEAQIQRQTREQQSLQNQLNDRKNDEIRRLKQENAEFQRIINVHVLDIKDKEHAIQQLYQLIHQLQQLQTVEPEVPQQVYITETGKCYHTREDCDGLRPAKKIWPEELSCVKGRLRPCSKCKNHF